MKAFIRKVLSVLIFGRTTIYKSKHNDSHYVGCTAVVCFYTLLKRIQNSNPKHASPKICFFFYKHRFSLSSNIVHNYAYGSVIAAGNLILFLSLSNLTQVG